MGTAFISIFLLGILTKYLPLEVFWMYNKIYNYLGIFAFLADLGLYTITIREITHNKKNARNIIGNVLTLRLVLWCIILWIAYGIGTLLPWYNSFFGLLSIIIVGGFTVVSLINSAVLALMQSYMKMEFSLLSVIVGKILTLAGVAYVAFGMFPVDSLPNYNVALMYIFGAGFIWILCTTLLNYIYATVTVFPLKFSCDTDYIRHIFRISLPYWIALFLGVVYFKVDVIILSLLEPENMADTSIALYALPMKIVEVLMVLGGFYLNSLLPSLTSAFQEKNMEKIQFFIDISLKILFSLWMCIFVFGTLFAENIIQIIANKDYLYSALHTYSSADVFGIVLMVLLFHFLSLVFIYVLIAAKKQSKLLYINAVVTVINIVGNILLIPHLSFLWAGLVTVFSQITLMILGYMSVRKLVHFSFDIRFFFFVTLWWGICFLIGTLLVNAYSLGVFWDVFIYGILGGITYSWIVWLYLRKKIILPE